MHFKLLISYCIILKLIYNLISKKSNNPQKKKMQMQQLPSSNYYIIAMTFYFSNS